MNRLSVFIIIFAGSIVGLLVNSYLFWTSQMGMGMMNMNMMMDMMYMRGMQEVFPYYPISNGILITATLVGIIGIVYYVVFPEIKKNQQVKDANQKEMPRSLSVVLQTLRPDEREVLEFILSHHGKVLQKEIVKALNLSRLKVHRIVARLSERGIIKVTEFGNTNKISVSDWLSETKNE